MKRSILADFQIFISPLIYELLIYNSLSFDNLSLDLHGASDFLLDSDNIYIFPGLSKLERLVFEMDILRAELLLQATTLL